MATHLRPALRAGVSGPSPCLGCTVRSLTLASVGVDREKTRTAEPRRHGDTVPRSVSGVASSPWGISAPGSTNFKPPQVCGTQVPRSLNSATSRSTPKNMSHSTDIKVWMDVPGKKGVSHVFDSGKDTAPHYCRILGFMVESLKESGSFSCFWIFCSIM